MGMLPSGRETTTRPERERYRVKFESLLANVPKHYTVTVAEREFWLRVLEERDLLERKG